MWDEDKFFKDFVNESENIKPDADFVARLKNMADDDGEQVEKIQKIRQIKIIRASVIAVSLMLCFTIGMIVLSHTRRLPNRQDTAEPNVHGDISEIHAGKTDSGIYVGTIGEETEIDKAIDMLEDNYAIVKDSEDNVIKMSERKKIIRMLNHSEQVIDNKKLEQLDSDKKYEKYTLTDGNNDSIKIKIYESGYIVINDNALYVTELS